ncbi:MAG: type II/IV secretion system protein [Ignavibacteriae bacterium]|nr:type II/IV secretion system protein [Ignavibacteria bacterium]MBI3365738.1 type II/IV secretion system protein [Ignavibacteriota bacterium]
MSTHNIAEKKGNFLQGIASAVASTVRREDGDAAALDPDVASSATNVEGTVTEQKPSPKQNGVGEENPQAGTKRPQASRLIEIFIEQGIVSEKTIGEALEIQRKAKDKEKKRLIDILIDDLGTDRDTVLKTVARHYSFESVDPTVIFGNKERLLFIRQLLDGLAPMHYDMAVRLKLLPYEMYVNGYDKLILITPDTTHPEVHTVARAFRLPKYEIKFVPTSQWQELWRQLAFDQGAKQLGLEGESGFGESEKDETEKEIEQSLDEIGRGKLNELIEGLFVDGCRTGASDIHIIPKGSHRTEFHFRIDGRLSLWSAVTDVRAEAVITVIKDRAKNLDRFEKFLSQDGFAQRMVDNKMIRFRFSTMPIYSSDLRSKLESIVIRILRGAENAAGIDTLGMPDATKELFVKAIRKPQGIVIFTGPTGSGKSTSQMAAIQTIMDPGINILTIEDPVEYLIDGCRQIKLNHKLDFEGALRGILRHDPDVVMVGEMRDKITAEIAVKLANTGHLIFSTLHTNDSISAITRLYNMGIEPFLLAYTINIVIAQRLIRKLCDRCKTADDNVDVDFLIECGLTDQEIKDSTFCKPVGCVHCIRGYRGRVGIFEALYMTKDMRKIILKSKDVIDEESLRNLATQNGMQTVRQSAINLVKAGITAIENVEGMIMEE